MDTYTISTLFSYFSPSDQKTKAMQFCNKREPSQVFLRRDYGSSMVRLRLAPDDITARGLCKIATNNWSFVLYCARLFVPLHYIWNRLSLKIKPIDSTAFSERNMKNKSHP